MPSSLNSSLRSKIRQSEQQSLGLEDELEFGSDEDLMETIGEIEVPEEEGAVPELPTRTPPIDSSASSRKLSKTSKSLRPSKLDEKRDRDGRIITLASSTHLLPPLPPVPSGSSLDLPTDMFASPDGRKRGSILGAFKVKGLRKWRDDQSTRTSLFTDSQSAGSTVSLSKIVSNTSSRPSFSTSLAQSSISNAPHLGPLPSFDSVSVSEQQRAAANHRLQQDIRHDHALLNQSPRRDESLPRSNANSPTASGRTSWSPSEISSAILPAFPATLTSLEPITVLVAQAAKKPPSSIMAGRSNGHSPSARWLPCTLVFTLFKICTGDDSTTSQDERTVAHIHVFSQKQLSASSGISSPVRRSRSTAGIAVDPNAPRVETERRYLTRQSSALVSDEDTDADGRKVVLRVLFGAEDRSKGNEWVIEMKDTAYLTEWVHQIKKTAIMINAEELGYGQAIRSAFESSAVSADELAHRLSVHARSVAEQRENSAPSPPTSLPMRKENSTSPAHSQPDVRSASVEAAQAAALSRSRSAEEPAVQNAVHGSTSLDSIGDSIDGLSLGTLNLGPNLAFPAPPSALPATRPVRTQAAQQHGSPQTHSRSAPPPPGAGSPQQPPPQHSAYPGSYGAPNGHGGPPSVFSAVPSGLGGQHVNGSANGSAHSLVNGNGSPQLPQSNGTLPSSPMSNGRVSFPPHHASTTSLSNAATPASNMSPGVANAEVLEDMPSAPVRPPTPPRRSSKAEPSSRAPAPASMLQAGVNGAGTPSIASTSNSGTSSTSRLRKLRPKPQVIDVMAEFSSLEAESMPPEEEEEPIRDDRERRIRFAEG